MDHNTAKVLIVDDDPVILRNIDSALNEVWNELKYKAIITKDYGELIPIRCYPQQLNQMFLNLLIHAGRAIELFGEIHITTRNIYRKVKILIALAGGNMDGADLSLVGDFFGAGKSLDQRPGLDLNVACGIIKKHGGTIDFDTKVGQGDFRVHIPVN